MRVALGRACLPMTKQLADDEQTIADSPGESETVTIIPTSALAT
jgi:hypothetical protein